MKSPPKYRLGWYCFSNRSKVNGETFGETKVIESKLESEIMGSIEDLAPKIHDEIRDLSMTSGIELRSKDVDNIYKLVTSLDQLASTLRRIQIYRSNVTNGSDYDNPPSFSD